MNELKIKKILREFSKKRDWDQFHSLKNLAISISLESSELLEIFQWEKDNSKFYKQDGSFIICPLSSIDTIITEKLDKKVNQLKNNFKAILTTN